MFCFYAKLNIEFEILKGDIVMKKSAVFSCNFTLKIAGGAMSIFDNTDPKIFLWRLRLIDE